MTPPHVIARNESPKFVAFAVQSAELIAVGKTLRRWRVSDGELLARVNGGGEPTAFAISEDRTILALATRDSIELRDAYSFDTYATVDSPGIAMSLSISFDNRLLAVRTMSNWNGVYQLPELTLATQFPCEDQLLYRDASFLPDGRLACTTNAGIDLVDVELGTRVARLAFEPSELRCEGLHYRDGRLFGRRAFEICEFDVESARLIRGFAEDAQSMHFIPSKKLLITGDIMGGIDFIDQLTGSRLRHVNGHAKSVNSLDVTPDGEWLASVGDEDDVRIWEVAKALSDPGAYNLTGGELVSHEYPNAAGVHFPSDGQRLLSARRGALHIWSVPGFTELKSIPIVEGQGGIQFLPDEEAFAVLWVDGRDETAFRAVLIDLHSGTLKENVEFPIPYARRASINHAKTVVAAFDHECLCLVRFPSGEILHRIPAHTGEVEDSTFSGLAFSADDRSLVTSGRDGTLCEWEVATGELLRTFQGSGKSIESFRFSLDNSLLAVCESHAIVILDAASWRVLQTISQVERIHWSSVAISPDNAMLAFASTHHKEIQFFNLKSGELFATFVGHTSGITDICFSSDGAYLATTSHDETLKIWKCPSAEYRSTKG